MGIKYPTKDGYGFVPTTPIPDGFKVVQPPEGPQLAKLVNDKWTYTRPETKLYPTEDPELDPVPHLPAVTVKGKLYQTANGQLYPELSNKSEQLLKQQKMMLVPSQKAGEPFQLMTIGEWNAQYLGTAFGVASLIKMGKSLEDSAGQSLLGVPTATLEQRRAELLSLIEDPKLDIHKPINQQLSAAQLKSFEQMQLFSRKVQELRPYIDAQAAASRQAQGIHGSEYDRRVSDSLMRMEEQAGMMTGGEYAAHAKLNQVATDLKSIWAGKDPFTTDLQPTDAQTLLLKDAPMHLGMAQHFQRLQLLSAIQPLASPEFQALAQAKLVGDEPVGLAATGLPQLLTQAGQLYQQLAAEDMFQPRALSVAEEQTLAAAARWHGAATSFQRLQLLSAIQPLASPEF
ncbi:MAG: hypothetical protein AAB281_03300, partial [Actinomycetota bacterium]